MKNIRLKRYMKFIILGITIVIFAFIYSSFFCIVNAEDEENSTDNILQSQANSLRDIKLYK